ncbi:MarR family transcriptional regulator [Sphingomonas faeni]|uniref:MarR family transcriptional regulator n=1 Tax=Sphingomonas faeni TaxID=185950 RepID=UPI0020C0B2C2|nr:MarR family transcriptional regulator [Sphingomonas faeni]MCK8455221.1 MarR family transcriptional regulator [Sphingomonas faeni]
MAERRTNPPAIDDVAFLGRTVERLSVLIAEQSKAVFDDRGIVIPVRSCSLMTVLAKLGAASASDLARELGHSHQLVMQKIPKLVSLGLIRDRPDDDDARRRLFQLTDKGTAQFAKFEQCTVLLRTAYARLFADVGDVKNLVERTTAALDDTPLRDRVDKGE